MRALSRPIASALLLLVAIWTPQPDTLRASEQLSVGTLMSFAESTTPKVRLVAPADGSFVTGQTMVKAQIEPARLASSAVFFVNGRELCRRTHPPYECEWDAGVAIAAHQVRLVVNLSSGGRLVESIRTAGVAHAETVDVDAVQVTVTVTDKRGRYVKGLPQSAFRVLEDGKPQTISHFYGDDAPLELVVAVDLSSSMAPALPGMKRAVASLLRMVPAQHRLTLIGFNDEVHTLLPRSADPALRDQVVDSLAAWGRTALYEGIIESVAALGSRPGRKAILVFTDGQDQGSRVTLEDVEATLHAGDQILYMTSQGQALVNDSLKQLMDRLARPTGGRTVATTNIDALQDAFKDLFEEMSHQYVLGYQSNADGDDDKWRSIAVQVDGDYRVRARQGYRRSLPLSYPSLTESHDAVRH